MPAADSAGRLFVGVAFPPGLRRALEAHVANAGPLPGRPAPPANWHLTLRFLGDTGVRTAERLTAALRAAPLSSAFGLSFGRLGAFPRPARAAVLWIGVEAGEAPLRALAAVVERAAVAAGFPAEPRPYAPHLTLARIQPPRDVRALIDSVPPFAGGMRVEEVVLFRSHLGGGPARYEAVERFALG